MQRLIDLTKLAVVFVMLGACPAVQAVEVQSLSGKVVRVVDGDTVVLEAEGERYRVRLGAIDAPERDQPWGESSTRSMRRILAGKEARVDYYKRDRWGRLIGYIWVTPPDCPTCGSTLDAGLYQLTVGMAWHFKRYAHEQAPEQRGQYKFAETEARAKKAGLWSDPEPIPPWEWRRMQSK
jgi:endonuclease YncB( thermonuclease family)